VSLESRYKSFHSTAPKATTNVKSSVRSVKRT